MCVPRNVHDSVSFFEAYNVMDNKFHDQIKNVCLDAGYVTQAICKTVLDDGRKIYVPYKRLMTKKDILRNMNTFIMKNTTVIFVQI